MYEQIRQWLASPANYSEGLSLYLKSRSDNKFDKFFQDAESSPATMHRKMLHQKLSNILRIHDAQPATANQPEIKPVDLKKAAPITVDPIKLPKKAKEAKTYPQIDANPFVRLEKLPEDLQEKFKGIIQPLRKEIAHYHEVAKLATTDADRKEAINKAAELEDQEAAVWKEIDTWYKEHELGEGKPADNTGKGNDPINTAEAAIKLTERIADLKTNINRAKKELKTLKDEKKIKSRNASIAKWEKEQAEKEAQLKALKGE